MVVTQLKFLSTKDKVVETFPASKWFCCQPFHHNGTHSERWPAFNSIINGCKSNEVGWWSSYLSLTDRYMPLMCRNSFALRIPNSFHFLRFQRWLMEIIWMWNEFMYIMGCKLNWHLYRWPALLISDDFVRSNEIIRTKWQIYKVIGCFVLTI